jgi:hypothetical protein
MVAHDGEHTDGLARLGAGAECVALQGLRYEQSHHDPDDDVAAIQALLALAGRSRFGSLKRLNDERHTEQTSPTGQ